MMTAAVLLLATISPGEPTGTIPQASANTGAGSATASGAAPSLDPQSVKCRRIREVDSRIPTRICRTVAEWDRIDAENQKAMTEQKRGGGQKPASGTIYG